jgi:predicted lipid-binding transport protein (Tim44 family)
VFYVVVLAMIAGFLAMRLYSVLGKRTGHEQVLRKPAEERVPPAPLPRTIDVTPEVRRAAPRPIDANAEGGLRAVIAADPAFDVGRFMDGAQTAYRLVLEAFWRGDEAALADLVEPEVLDAFRAAIEARTTAGHVLDNRLVSIERALVTAATVEDGAGRITVKFDADIAAVTRDGDGNVVAGSMTDAVQTHDLWTFARPIKSRDPNWKLADTDEA